MRELLDRKINVNRFKLDLFERKAELNFLNLSLNPASEGDISVDGKVTVNYADYRIFITLYGSAKSPQLIFESEPTLSEKSIISVLLFGRPIEEADVTENESTNQFQAAAAQGALGLTSLFLFAKTPIESFNYDPTSDTYSARVRLGKRTSFVVGRNSETSQFGLRQKVGPNLFIETFVQEEPDGSTSTSGVIEWSKRYD